MVIKIIGTIWRMGLQASILILFILAVRPFLRRYPKIYSYVLWILVGISLLCPMSIPSPFSLQPELPDSMTFLEDDRDAGANTLPSKESQNPTAISGLSPENSIASGTAFQPTAAAMQPDGRLEISSKNNAANPDNTPETKNRGFLLFCALYLTGASIVSLCCFVHSFRRATRGATPS